MSARFVVNQDRDRIYPFDPHAFVYTTPIPYDGICIGNNLMLGTVSLGTFETPEEAVAEVAAIFNSTAEIYAVNGYSEWRAGI